MAPLGALKMERGHDKTAPGWEAPRVDAPLNCMLCGSRDARRVPAGKGPPWLHRCAVCGLLRVYPIPSATVLASIYNDDYFETFGYGIEDPRCYRAVRGRFCSKLLALAERHFAVGALLDVGSGLGDMLAEANRRGWHATGVEPNAWARRHADCVAPQATQTCAVEDFEPDEARFDLVTCVEVIEHLRCPDDALRRFLRCLRPGGGLLMTTPDIGSLLARMMGAHWPHFHIDHLWYFNRATLTAIVEQAGFEVLAWRRAPKIFNLAYILGILKHNAKSRLLKATARACLRVSPSCLLSSALPTIGEGQMIIARRPPC